MTGPTLATDYVSLREQCEDENGDGYIELETGTLLDILDNPRDEFHTMDELYEYRMLYNAILFNEWATAGVMSVCKSWFHSDDEKCFGGGWFIVVAELPTGQISNHYKAEHWDLFKVPAVERPPTYDGHSPADVADRMNRYLRDAETTGDKG